MGLFSSSTEKPLPVINFRPQGPTVSGRSLFEGTRSPKAKRKFTQADEEWICFAGVWCPIGTQSVLR
jgi:hypothetical protein